MKNRSMTTDLGMSAPAVTKYFLFACKKNSATVWVTVASAVPTCSEPLGEREHGENTPNC